VGFVRGPRPATAAGVLTVALTAAERAQEARDSGRQVTGPGGEPFREIRAGVAHRRDRPAHRADAALGASGGEAGVLRLLIPARSAGGTCSAKPAGGERHRGQCSGDESLRLVPDRVAGHRLLPDSRASTRRLSSFNAVSMMTFSALRLNMPSIPIASSTERV